MRIKVGPYSYKVIVKKLRKKFGTCDFRTHEIFIDPNQSPDTKRDSLMHEILHAVDDLAGIKQREEEINRRSPILLMVLRDNKQLIKQLLQE